MGWHGVLLIPVVVATPTMSNSMLPSTLCWVCSESHGIGFVRCGWKAFWSWLIAAPS